MILSFAWTSLVLLSGQKTCTRRSFCNCTAQTWLKAYNNGRLVHQAWDKCAFCHLAKKIADIRLTQLIYQERLCDMPESDLEAEGGLWASGQEFIDLFGGDSNRVVWVVRFELVQVIN